MRGIFIALAGGEGVAGHRGRSSEKMDDRTHTVFLFLIFPLCGCRPSLDDLVEQLAASPEDRESARQELLLAKDRAVTPLLAALADSSLSGARPYLVDVLLSLMMRVEDGRIRASLQHHLLSDPVPDVRERIARGLGLQRRSEGIEALVEALQEDGDAGVRYESLLALNRLEDKMNDDQRDRVHARALELAADSHDDTRMEARIRLAGTVDRWIGEARKAELAADLDGATDLYEKARASYPNSKRANHRLGRHHYDNGRKEEGLELLRRHGMLLDVPRFTSAPLIDGRLDDTVWSVAARGDTFYQFSQEHHAAIPSGLLTELYLGYTAEAIFIGFRGHDDNPDSIVVTDRGHDEGIFWEDVTEIFLDTNFDHRGYVHAGVNTRGVVADAYLPIGLPDRGITDEERAWNAHSEAAAHVGPSFWSMEYRLNYGQPQVPRPEPGTVWGFNFARTYRGKEYTQWVRVYGFLAHTPDDFGVLLFR